MTLKRVLGKREHLVCGYTFTEWESPYIFSLGTERRTQGRFILGDPKIFGAAQRTIWVTPWSHLTFGAQGEIPVKPWGIIFPLSLEGKSLSIEKKHA